MCRMLMHYILVIAVKIERVFRRQKIKIINKSALNNLKGKSAPIIFAPTHCGKYDIQVLAEVLWDFKWSLLSGDPYELPGTIEGVWLKLNGVVYVDRDNKEYRKRAKKQLIDLLMRGENIMLYPEGTWNFSANLPVLPLFRGVADIAASTNAIIVPFGLEIDDKTNTYYVMIGKPIVPDNEPLVILEKLRDQMATLKWQLFEKLYNYSIRYDNETLISDWEKYIEKRLSECRYMSYELIWKYSRKESWQMEREKNISDIDRLRGENVD